MSRVTDEAAGLAGVGLTEVAGMVCSCADIASRMDAREKPVLTEAMPQRV